MKRYLLAGAFVAVFVTPALAEQFYVAFKCTMMHSQPAAPMKEHGRALQDGSRGPQSHGQHERVRRLKIRNSLNLSWIVTSSGAKVGDLSHEITSGCRNQH